MPDETAILLILLLPALWGVVFLIRALMGGRFKSSDKLAKEGTLLTSQWALKQQGALHRYDEDKEALRHQEELEKEIQGDAHVYPVRTTKMDHLRKVHHVGEEKEAHFPEIKKPETKRPDKKKPDERLE